MTDNEKEMYEALCKIWDLTFKLPSCQTSLDIAQLVASIIYKDN